MGSSVTRDLAVGPLSSMSRVDDPAVSGGPCGSAWVVWRVAFVSVILMTAAFVLFAREMGRASSTPARWP